MNILRIIKCLKFLLITLFCVSISIAENGVFFNKLNKCSISKTETSDYEPIKFNTSNNLINNIGKKENYNKKIIVYGKILDQHCVPVTNANIFIWQVGSNGKYPYKPLKKWINHDLIEINKKNSFIGNGIASTNNKGEFYFITLYPLSIDNLGSHINARVKHHRLGLLETKLYLKGHKINKPQSDPELSSIFIINDDDSTIFYKFNVILPGTTLKSY